MLLTNTSFTNGFFEEFLAETPTEESYNAITGFFAMKQIPQLILLETNNCGDLLNDLFSRSQILHLEQEQQNNEVVQKVLLW